MDAAEPVPLQPAEMLQPGDALGRFQLLCPIARGGMGVVWAARQTGRLGLPGLVAIKIALRYGRRIQECLFDEAKVAASIDHPNVCKIFELGQDGENLFIAMEWIYGVSLSYLLKSSPQRRLDYRIAAQLVSQAAAGLHAAHELRDDEGTLLEVVHRDATPQNLLIAATGDLKVVDFGIVKAKNQLHQATETGELKGKLSYLSPEQVRGKALDRRADVFSLACVLYVATTGRSPFNDGAAATTITRIMKGEYPPPSALVEDYPEALERILVKALASDPADRYQSADELCTALSEFAVQGPEPVTREHVAQLVNERCGKSIEACRANIRAAQRSFDSQATRLHQRRAGGVEPPQQGSGTYSAVGRDAPPSVPAPRSGVAPQSHFEPVAPGVSLHNPASSVALPSDPTALDPRPPQAARTRAALIAGVLAVTSATAIVFSTLRSMDEAPRGEAVRAAAVAEQRVAADVKPAASPVPTVEASAIATAPPEAALDPPRTSKGAPRSLRRAAPRAVAPPPSTPRAGVTAAPPAPLETSQRPFTQLLERAVPKPIDERDPFGGPP